MYKGSVFIRLILAIVLVGFQSSALAEAFKLLIASDPQPFRVGQTVYKFGNESSISNSPETSKQLLKHIVAKMNQESNISLTIINGDTVENPLIGQVDTFTNDVFGPLGGHNDLYPGLGNHDVDENDTAGTRNRYQYLIDFIDARKNDSGFYWEGSTDVVNADCPNWTINMFDSDFELDLPEEDNNARTRDKLIHYAFKKGDYLFIQLNVNPYFGKKVGNTIFRRGICFMEKMMQIGKSKNLKIVLNYHAHSSDYYSPGSTHDFFSKFVAKYPVVAIFVGHIHDYLGRRTISKYKNSNNQYVDVIYSGAMFLSTYLVAEFRDDRIIITPRYYPHSKFRNYSYSNNDLRPFHITFGAEERSRPIVSTQVLSRKLTMGPVNLDPETGFMKGLNSSPVVSDKGYTTMPRFKADINNDNLNDYGRFVGSQNDARLAWALASGTNQFNAGSQYTHWSRENFDRGYVNSGTGDNPYLEDVDFDGDLDYVRRVGSHNSPYKAVALNHQGAGFARKVVNGSITSENQYFHYFETYSNKDGFNLITDPLHASMLTVTYDKRSNTDHFNYRFIGIQPDANRKPWRVSSVQTDGVLPLRWWFEETPKGLRISTSENSGYWAYGSTTGGRSSHFIYLADSGEYYFERERVPTYSFPKIFRLKKKGTNLYVCLTGDANNPAGNMRFLNNCKTTIFSYR